THLLRLFPIKIRQPGNQEGTHGTKTSYRRDCSCNGADHPNGHDVGRVADLPPSTFAFVLGRSTSFLPPTLDARRRVAGRKLPIGWRPENVGGLKRRIVPVILVCDRWWLARHTDGHPPQTVFPLGPIRPTPRLQTCRR